LSKNGTERGDIGVVAVKAVCKIKWQMYGNTVQVILQKWLRIMVRWMWTRRVSECTAHMVSS
jgi:hypothetical protein